jgi:hypothetical protein
MIRVTVEVREGTVSCRVRVTAPSIERALELADSSGRGEARVRFPIEPKSFFVRAAKLPGRAEVA